MIYEALLAAKSAAREGLGNGSLRIVGSVVRYTSGKLKGRIHSHLQPTSASEFAQQAALNLDGLQQGQDAMKAMLGSISGGVRGIQVMSGLNLALSVADIGIFVVGFALMNAKLNAVQRAIQEVAIGIKLIQQNTIDRDFIKLRALADRYENTWHMVDSDRAVSFLMDIANNAVVKATHLRAP